MTRIQKKNAIIFTLILTAVGILVGAVLLLLSRLLTESVLTAVIRIALIVCGVCIIADSIPSLIGGIARINTKWGLFDLCGAVLSIMLGILLIFFQNTVLVTLIGVYLIVLPVLRLILSPDRKSKWVAELIRIALGVLVLIFLPAVSRAALKVIQLILQVAGWAGIGVSVILAVIALIRIALGKNEKNAPTHGGNVYVDYTGDGKVDTIYMDTTGDGVPDTEYKVDSEQ